MNYPTTNFFVLFIITSLVLLPMRSGLACQNASAHKNNNEQNSDDCAHHQNTSRIGTFSSDTYPGSSYSDFSLSKDVKLNTQQIIMADINKSDHINHDTVCDSECCSSCAHSFSALSTLINLTGKSMPPPYFYSTSFFKEPDLTLHHPPPIFFFL